MQKIQLLIKILIKKFIIIALMVLMSFGVNITTLAIDYKAKIAETERQAQDFVVQLNKTRNDIESTRKKMGSLQEEINTLNAESKKFSDQATTAKNLAKKYDEEKKIKEDEIVKLKAETKLLYKELQKKSMSNPMQNLFAARNLGEVISKVYEASSLEKRFVEIQDKTKQEVAQKEIAIQKQQEVAKEGESLEQKALAQKAQVQLLLEQTKGDETKYKSIAEEANRQIDQANAQKAKYAQAEKEEQERIAKELEAQRKFAEEQAKIAALTASTNQYSNNTNYATISTGFSNYDYSGKCRYQSSADLSVSKGYFVTPTTGRFEREFGLCNHDGLDISNSVGTPVVASASGKVVRAGFTYDGYGNNVVISHSLSGGQTVYSLYGHLTSYSVAVGDTVSSGQQIGQMGNTGNSTGPHLHFMLIDGASYDGPACQYGGSKCFKPRDYINF